VDGNALQIRCTTRYTPMRHMPVNMRFTPYEIYAGEVHAHEMHAHEIHAYKI
jgi:hypothetical protein